MQEEGFAHFKYPWDLLHPCHNCQFSQLKLGQHMDLQHRVHEEACIAPHSTCHSPCSLQSHKEPQTPLPPPPAQPGYTYAQHLSWPGTPPPTPRVLFPHVPLPPCLPTATYLCIPAGKHRKRQQAGSSVHSPWHLVTKRESSAPHVLSHSCSSNVWVSMHTHMVPLPPIALPLLPQP